MMSFEDKLKAVFSLIERDNNSICEYKVYNGQKDALSIFNEVELEAEESSALLKILANVSPEEKITLVSVKSNSDEDYEIDKFVFPESAINEMFDAIDWEEEVEEEWEIALASENFGIDEIETIREYLADEEHDFILEIIEDSYDILDFVNILKNNKNLKKELVAEVSKGLCGLLGLEDLKKPVVVFISADSTVAFVGDENFKALQEYIVKEVESSSDNKAVEYEDGYGSLYYEDEDEDDDENYYEEYDEEEDGEDGVVAPFWLL